MMKWGWNEGYFLLKCFAFVKKYLLISPHSVIPTSFLNDICGRNVVEMKEWQRNGFPSIVIFISSHFSESKMRWEWRDGEEWGWFRRSAKNASPEIRFIRLSVRNDLEMKESGAVSYIRDSTRFFHSDLIWFIPQPFSYFSLIQEKKVLIAIKWCPNEWRMTLKWKNRVMSLI